MKPIRDRWWLLLMFSAWILMGLWLMSCIGSGLQKVVPKYDLEDPKECISHFLELFADFELAESQEGGLSNTGVTRGGSVSGKASSTKVTVDEMNWISLVCYLPEQEARRFIFECAESLAPCPIRDVMNRCYPEEMQHGVQPEPE